MKGNELVPTKLLKGFEKADLLGTKETPSIFNGRIQSPQDGTK